MADVLARRLGASWEEEELAILAFDDEGDGLEEEEWEEDDWEEEDWEEEDEWEDEDDWEEEWEEEEEEEWEEEEAGLGRRPRREDW